MNLQRVGGVASVANAFLTAVVVFIIAAVFPRLGLVTPSDWTDPVKSIAAWPALSIPLSSLNIALVLMSIAALLTILALRERMHTSAPTLMRIAVIATSIGCAIWVATGLIEFGARPSILNAKDVSAYRALIGMCVSLSTAGDHGMGWAVFLTGWAALRTAKLPRILSCLGVLTGAILILGFLSMPLDGVGYVLFIIWSLWLGVVLLRSNT